MPPQETPAQNQPSSPYPTVPNIVPGQPIPPPPKKSRPWGWMLSLTVFIIAFLAASGYGLMVTGQRDDYKNNVKEKIAEAIVVAEQKLEKEKEADFLEREKSPYRTYSGPSAYGEVQIQYPKTWSATVTESAKGKAAVSGLFHPSFVPGADSGTGFALSLQVLAEPYDKALSRYESNARKGVVRISPYSAPNVPDVLGVRIDGGIVKDHQGSTVLFPLRDKTISLTTLSPQFVPDFNNVILANLVFTP